MKFDPVEYALRKGNSRLTHNATRQPSKMSGRNTHQAPSNRAHSGYVEVPELSLYPYFDDVDPRWDEERPYDEASGPRNPHRGNPHVYGTKV